MRLTLVPVILFACLAAGPVHAYVGPGLGLGAIGAFFGIVFAVFLAIVGLFWYPLKRLVTGRGKDEVPEEEPAEDAVEPTRKEAENP
jgi:hypothetical protein